MDTSPQIIRKYTTTSPFPHIVVDNFLPLSDADKLLAQFPSCSSIPWQRFNNKREVKHAFNEVDNLSEFYQSILTEYLMSDGFLEELQTLTGQKKLYPDPYFLGGGLHYITQGGKLDVHTDFNFHPTLKKTRKLNLLIFLNKDWKDEYGGHLELWNKDMTKCEARIRPIFNRAVIFTIDDESWHGHPHPLTCPDGEGRKSIAMYYYIDGMPDICHSTVFKDVPDGYDYSLTPLL